MCWLASPWPQPPDPLVGNGLNLTMLLLSATRGCLRLHGWCQRWTWLFAVLGETCETPEDTGIRGAESADCCVCSLAASRPSCLRFGARLQPLSLRHPPPLPTPGPIPHVDSHPSLVLPLDDGPVNLVGCLI